MLQVAWQLVCGIWHIGEGTGNIGTNKVESRIVDQGGEGDWSCTWGGLGVDSWHTS